jgi:hypothetical protein
LEDEMKRSFLSGIVAMAVAMVGPAAAQPVARPSAAAAPAYRDIGWEDLVPKGWDPAKVFEGRNLDAISDTDPRMEALLQEMRKVWDNAPVNRQLEGQAVRLPGYVVPLEQSRGQLREFLLVPYFGACIHSPPPPANQIVHVVLAQPVRSQSMDVVWVRGVLRLQRGDSSMGVSGYRLEAAQAVPYEPAQK